jgi:transposase-like protein
VQRYGISKGGVLTILAERGVTRRYQQMPADQIDEAVHLYVDDELSIRAIANWLDKSKGSVWKACTNVESRCARLTDRISV